MKIWKSYYEDLVGASTPIWFLICSSFRKEMWWWSIAHLSITKPRNTGPSQVAPGELRQLTRPGVYPLVNDHIAGWKIPIFNRKYIFLSGSIFHCYVSLPECISKIGEPKTGTLSYSWWFRNLVNHCSERGSEDPHLFTRFVYIPGGD